MGERRQPGGGHWADVAEIGASWGVSTIALVYRFLGRDVCQAVLALVVLYYFGLGGASRSASLDYLRRAWSFRGAPRKPGAWESYRHFLAFAVAALDKLAAWTGGVRPQDVAGVHDGAFHAAKASGRGAVVLTAHLGNPEVIRAIASTAGRFRVNVLVHTLHAERFNRILARVAPQSPVRLIQASRVGLAQAMMLSDAVSRGEWVVITADRIAVNDGESTSMAASFLGAPALFPTGPFILASALKCPVFTMFCLKVKRSFEVRFELLADPMVLPRQERDAAIAGYLAVFVARLEQCVRDHPLQWFNFYDFWQAPKQQRQVEQAA